MSFSEKIDVAILGAVSQEVQGLDALLKNCQITLFAGGTFKVGEFQDKVLLVGVTGIGKVNAAITASALLAHYHIKQVWNIGCAGCFNEGSLAVGDVLITERVFCGDEGILSTDAVQSSRELGIPLFSKEQQVFFDFFPASAVVATLYEFVPPGRYCLSQGSLPVSIPTFNNGNSSSQGSFQLAYGPSLSIGMVSGDREVARRRYLQYGALAENMEGSAIAQACLRFDTPFVECRGMSNKVGDRNKRDWQIERAVAHCHAILIGCLRISV